MMAERVKNGVRKALKLDIRENKSKLEGVKKRIE